MSLSIEEGHYERLMYKREDILKYMPDGNKRLFHAALLAMYYDSVWNDSSLDIRDVNNTGSLLKIIIRL